jgi:phosphoglucosamine mutase
LSSKYLSSNSKRLFGTDGIRGEAGKFPLDPRTIRTIGESLAKHLSERTRRRAPQIIIGRDTRESGPWIEQALIEGARSAGAEVQSAGVITTPGVAFLTRALPADAGVVISASHNSFEDNGIKIFDPSGRKLSDETERQIELDIAADNERGVNEDVQTTTPTPINGSAAELRGRYLEYLARDIAHDLSLENLSMVIDCANGASYEIAPQLFEKLGARVITINNTPDGQNINRECGSLHLQVLKQKVVAESTDLGVAFDGDADRALFADEKGNVVDGDATLWVLARHMQKHHQLVDDTVVATVMSNVGLEIGLKSHGIKLSRTDVGDKYVLDELLSSGATLGGEQSGHIIFPKLSLAGDGLITTLQLLRAMKERAQPLSELTRGFQRYPQTLVNVRVIEKRPFDQIPTVTALAREIEAKLAGRGRLLLRYSGTEPLARVMIEGEKQSEIEDYANALAQAIRLELEV